MRGIRAKAVLAESPESESARKRRRLSSPTYDEQFPITQEDIHTFEEADKQLSQAMYNSSTQRRRLPSEEPDESGGAAVDDDILGGAAEEAEARDGEKEQGTALYVR